MFWIPLSLGALVLGALAFSRKSPSTPTPVTPTPAPLPGPPPPQVASPIRAGDEVRVRLDPTRRGIFGLPPVGDAAVMLATGVSPLGQDPPLVSGNFIAIISSSNEVLPLPTPLGPFNVPQALVTSVTRAGAPVVIGRRLMRTARGWR